MIIKSIINAIRHRKAVATKWEYCEKTYSNRVARNEYERNQCCFSFPIFNDRELNDMGMEGWEAINVNRNEWTTRVLFKRLKSD